MRLTVSLLILSWSVCISGCYKSPPTIYHHVANDIKTDFNFKAGSYWIMKDSISGRIDSFFVTNYLDVLNQTTLGGHDYPSVYDESITINISEYNTDLSHVADSLDWAYSFGGSEAGLTYRALPYYPFYTIGAIRIGFFGYPKHDSFVLSTYYQPDEDTGVINQRFSTFQINSLSFNTVAVINHYYSTTWRDSTGNLSYSWYNDLFYVSPKIGIIKMRLDHHFQDTIERVWEIQRWNIVN